MSDNVGNRKAAKLTFVVMLIALVCVSIYIGYLFLTGIKSASADTNNMILDTGVVYNGVSSLGVDLSGTQRGEVPQQLKDAAQKILDSVQLNFTVNDKTIKLNAQDMGAGIDTAGLLSSAYAVGRDGSFDARSAGILDAKNKAWIYPIS